MIKRQVNHLPLLFIRVHMLRRDNIACCYERPLPFALVILQPKENRRKNTVVLENHMRIGPHTISISATAFLYEFFAVSTSSSKLAVVRTCRV